MPWTKNFIKKYGKILGITLEGLEKAKTAFLKLNEDIKYFGKENYISEIKVSPDFNVPVIVQDTTTRDDVAFSGFYYNHYKLNDGPMLHDFQVLDGSNNPVDLEKIKEKGMSIRQVLSFERKLAFSPFPSKKFEEYKKSQMIKNHEYHRYNDFILLSLIDTYILKNLVNNASTEQIAAISDKIYEEKYQTLVEKLNLIIAEKPKEVRNLFGEDFLNDPFIGEYGMPREILAKHFPQVPILEQTSSERVIPPDVVLNHYFNEEEVKTLKTFLSNSSYGIKVFDVIKNLKNHDKNTVMISLFKRSPIHFYESTLDVEVYNQYFADLYNGDNIERFIQLALDYEVFCQNTNKINNFDKFSIKDKLETLNASLRFSSDSIKHLEQSLKDLKQKYNEKVDVFDEKLKSIDELKTKAENEVDFNKLKNIFDKYRIVDTQSINVLELQKDYNLLKNMPIFSIPPFNSQIKELESKLKEYQSIKPKLLWSKYNEEQENKKRKILEDIIIIIRTTLLNGIGKHLNCENLEEYIGRYDKKIDDYFNGLKNIEKIPLLELSKNIKKTEALIGCEEKTYQDTRAKIENELKGLENSQIELKTRYEQITRELLFLSSNTHMTEEELERLIYFSGALDFNNESISNYYNRYGEELFINSNIRTEHFFNYLKHGILTEDSSKVVNLMLGKTHKRTYPTGKQSLDSKTEKINALMQELEFYRDSNEQRKIQ